MEQGLVSGYSQMNSGLNLYGNRDSGFGQSGLTPLSNGYNTGSAGLNGAIGSGQQSAFTSIKRSSPPAHMGAEPPVVTMGVPTKQPGWDAAPRYPTEPPSGGFQPLRPVPTTASGWPTPSASSEYSTPAGIGGMQQYNNAPIQPKPSMNGQNFPQPMSSYNQYSGMPSSGVPATNGVPQMSNGIPVSSHLGHQNPPHGISSNGFHPVDMPRSNGFMDSQVRPGGPMKLELLPGPMTTPNPMMPQQPHSGPVMSAPHNGGHPIGFPHAQQGPMGIPPPPGAQYPPAGAHPHPYPAGPAALINFMRPPLQQTMTCEWIDQETKQICHQKVSTMYEIVLHMNNDHIGGQENEDHTCYWKDCERKQRTFKAKYKLVNHMR